MNIIILEIQLIRILKTIIKLILVKRKKMMKILIILLMKRLKIKKIILSLIILIDQKEILSKKNIKQN